MSSERTRAVTLASIAGLLQRGGQVLSALIVFPILARSLGVEQFGIWGAATSLIWVTSTLDLGVGNALITLIPRALSRRLDLPVSDIVAAAVVSTVAMALSILVAEVGALYAMGGRSDTAFIVAGVALAINIPLGLAGRLWLAVQKGHVGSNWEFIQTCISAILLVAGAWSRWTTSELVACVYAAMLVANSASLAHFFWRHPQFRPQGIPTQAAVKGLSTHGGAILGVSVAASALWGFDNALTLFLLGPIAAAWMTVAQRLCTTAFGFITVISTSLWPAFADAAHHDHAWVSRGLWRGGALLTGLSLVGSLILATVGGPILRLWLGRDLGVDQTMLWTVGVWVTAAAAVQAPLLLLLAVSRPRAPLIALTCAAICGLALKFLIAPHFGPAGILAVNPALNALVVLPACLWAAMSWLRRPDLGPSQPSHSQTA